MNPAKSKTIKKVIQAKIDDWLESIPDDLAKSVKNKIVVSGGCIFKSPLNWCEKGTRICNV